MNEPQSDEHTYRGTFTEIGLAFAFEVPVVIYNPNSTKDENGNILPGLASNVFYWLPNITYEQSEDIIKTWRNMSQKKVIEM